VIVYEYKNQIGKLGRRPGTPQKHNDTSKGTHWAGTACLGLTTPSSVSINKTDITQPIKMRLVHVNIKVSLTQQ